MLICLVLCAAAVLPTALSERPEAQNVQPQGVRNNEIGRRLPAGYAPARNQGLLRLQKYEADQSPEISDDLIPFLSNIYLTLWSKNPYPLPIPLGSDLRNDFLEKSDFLGRSLDQTGNGHLLRREAILDSIGGGHLLKREDAFRALDPIGGGHLLKRGLQLRQLDSIGGGHLLKKDALDAIGGGHLLKRLALDAIGGGHLLKRLALDAIGGGHLLKRSYNDDARERNSDSSAKYNEATLL